jgi:hypothetical protein
MSTNMRDGETLDPTLGDGGKELQGMAHDAVG